MAGNSAGERKLGEQLFQPGFVLGDVRVNFAPSAFEVNVTHDRRTAVPGTGDIKHIQVILLDDPVQVHIDEVLARRGAPVPDHQRLHVCELQRSLQQRIIVEINLADRQIVGGAPVGVDALKQFGSKSRYVCFHIVGDNLKGHLPQAKGVADDGNGTQAHRGAGDDRAEQQPEKWVKRPGCQRDAQRVVQKGE